MGFDCIDFLSLSFCLLSAKQSVWQSAIRTTLEYIVFTFD